jgi:mutator protein MutT
MPLLKEHKRTIKSLSENFIKSLSLLYVILIDESENDGLNKLDMTHEVVAALIIQSQKILLGQRSATREFYPNVWDVFGGHMELDEGHEQTLVRELEEELGITPVQWTYLQTLIEPSVDLTVHLYLVTEWIGTPVNRQPDEHSTINWFTVAEATQLSLADPLYPTLFARYLSAE